MSTNTYLLNWISLTETSSALSIHAMVYSPTRHAQLTLIQVGCIGSVRVSVWTAFKFFLCFCMFYFCFWFESCFFVDFICVYDNIYFPHSKRVNILISLVHLRLSCDWPFETSDSTELFSDRLNTLASTDNINYWNELMSKWMKKLPNWKCLTWVASTFLKLHKIGRFLWSTN